MPVDFSPIIAVGFLCFAIAVFTFARALERYRKANDPDPVFRAAAYTAILAVTFAIVGFFLVAPLAALLLE